MRPQWRRRGAGEGAEGSAVGVVMGDKSTLQYPAMPTGGRQGQESDYRNWVLKTIPEATMKTQPAFCRSFFIR